MIISLDKYKATGGGGEKPTEVLTQTITDNGLKTFNPQEGYVFSSAEITTDVHPTEALVATIDKNSTYHFIGEYNGADITTDVHPTEKLIETINDNGIYSFEGEYNGADITTDVHPTEALFETFSENGIYSFDREYNGATITVDVPTLTPTENVDITANGIYDVTNYATASVNVQPSDNYSYFDGVVDVEGLRAIGWNDESIGMYRDNDRHYAWQNSDYIVSEENKALNGVIVDENSVSSNKDNPNFKYCPFFDTSNVTNMGNMFYSCRALTSIPALDTTKVTNMSGMFWDCSSLTSIPLLDTSKVTNIGYMFCNCSSLTSIPLLDTSNVNYMFKMLSNCSSLTSIPQLNTSNATDMTEIFYNCSSLTSIPQLNTSKVNTMQSMFYSCSSLTSIPLLDTSKVTNMSSMFSGCSSLTSIPLLDTSNVTNMSYFFGWSNIKTLTDLGGFKNLSISVTSSFLDMCPNLTVESLMNVINNLATVSGKSLSFGSTNLNKLTAEQIAIATSKGWTLT